MKSEASLIGSIAVVTIGAGLALGVTAVLGFVIAIKCHCAWADFLSGK